MRSLWLLGSMGAAALLLIHPGIALAVDLTGDVILDYKVIPSVAGGFGGTLSAYDRFGGGIARLRDLDGDGERELAVGANTDDANGLTDVGVVWLLFMANDGSGSVVDEDWLSSGAPGVTGLASYDWFGISVAGPGDVPGAPTGAYTPDLVVGAQGNDPPTDGGGIWIYDLQYNGPGDVSVISSLQVANGIGGVSLDAYDEFGSGLALIGDLDDNGVTDIAVGARKDDDGFPSPVTDQGAVWILFLDYDSMTETFSVIDAKTQKISATSGGFTGTPGASARFGTDVTGLGDMDGDGVEDIAVGSPNQPDGGSVFILHLNPDGTVKSQVEIGAGKSGFGGALGSGDQFGRSLAWLGYIEGRDGGVMAVGAPGLGNDTGSAWILWVRSDGTVEREEKIAHAVGGPTGSPIALTAGGYFGMSAAPLGNIDAMDGLDVAIGAHLGGASQRGMIFTLKLASCPATFGLPVLYESGDPNGARQCLPSDLSGPPPHPLHLYLGTGPTASTSGTLCRPEPDGGNGDELCAWDVRVALDGGLTIQSFAPADLAGYRTNEVGGLYPEQDLRINWIEPGNPSDPTGAPIPLGDLIVDDDGWGGTISVGAGSIGVGASAQIQPLVSSTIALPEPAFAPGLLAGAALLLGLWRRRERRRAAEHMLLCALLVVPLTSLVPSLARAATSVKSQQIFGYSWPAGELYRSAVLLGDVDRNGVDDLAVGRNSTWYAGVDIVFMERKGTTLSEKGRDQSIGDNFDYDDFSVGLAAIGDRDGDGVTELAIGAPAYSHTTERGRVTILYLDDDGTEKSRHHIGEGLGNFGTGLIDVNDDFGHGVASVGDIDGDTIGDLAVGMPGQDADKGSVWIVLLDQDELVKSKFEITDVGPGNALDLPAAGDRFGHSVAAIGDLDGNGTPDIAVGATGDDGAGNTDRGAIYILFLDWDAQTQTLGVLSHTKLAEGLSGMPSEGYDFLGSRALVWHGDVTGEGGGVLSSRISTAAGVYYVQLLYIGADGFYRSGYRLDGSAGASLPVNGLLGLATVPLPDWNGDEVPDLFVGYAYGGFEQGYVLYMQDSDHDGLHDNLDNCPLVHNPVQEDADADGVGDLCDNCVAVANADQADADDPDDGEGDVCERVEVVLQTTGTPASPAWDLFVRCGAFAVTEIHGGIVLPAGHTGTPSFTIGCSSPPVGTICGTIDGGASSSQGPGLASPTGVRGDTIYYSIVGSNGTAPDNRLCNALDPPAKLAELTTGAIAGTQLAAAALTEEGLGSEILNLDLARNAAGAVPVTEIRMVQGPPLPLIDLELGPAVAGGSCSGGGTPGAACASDGDCSGGTCTPGTRWDVCLNGSEEFHRVAFGLIAPVGTTAASMRWVGCTTSGAGDVRSCGGGTGFGPSVNAAKSWTVGPSASPAGTLLDHTLYVVLEGKLFSSGVDPTLNFQGETVCLGAVELDSSPDLEPALTLDGINDVEDLFNAPNPVTPYEQVQYGALDVTQVRLIGKFNPADDIDGDGIQDLADNCPFIDNPSQTNRGSFKDPTDESDSQGDACQCAESTDDGAVLDPDDYEEIRNHLAGKITNPVVAEEIEERCSVVGTTECNMRDLLMLRLALDGVLPNVETRCDAALSPTKP